MNTKEFIHIIGEKHLMKEKLSEKGCTVIGEFSSFGEYSPFGFNFNCKSKLAFIGGREKGHPNNEDLENARIFAKGLLK